MTLSPKISFFKNFLIIFEDSIFEEPISVIIVLGDKNLFILRIRFLYSLIGVHKIIKSDFFTPSSNFFIIIPGSFNFFILEYLILIFHK